MLVLVGGVVVGAVVVSALVVGVSVRVVVGAGATGSVVVAVIEDGAVVGGVVVTADVVDDLEGDVAPPPLGQLEDSPDHQRDEDGSKHSQADQNGGLAVPWGRPGFGLLAPVAVVVLAGRRFTWVVWRSLGSVTRHGRRS